MRIRRIQKNQNFDKKWWTKLDIGFLDRIVDPYHLLIVYALLNQ